MKKIADDILKKLNHDEKRMLEIIQHYVNLNQKIPYHKESGIRKHIIKCPNLFKIILDEYISNENRNDVLVPILKNSIKYIDIHDNSQNNWKYFYQVLMKTLFEGDVLKPSNQRIGLDKNVRYISSKMTTDVIKNNRISPHDKFPFLLVNRLDTVVIKTVSVDILNSYFDQITKYQNKNYSDLTFLNMRQLLVFAIDKSDFESYLGINYCLSLLLIFLRKPELRYPLEILIKMLVSSKCLEHLENDVLELILESWKVLEEETTLKLRLNPHPQTAKRLVRLQESYQLMKYLFRDKVANRDDVRSKLDALFMG